MNKTLLTHFPGTNYQAHADLVASGQKDLKLEDLMQEMKTFLREASADLLQPRTEAIARILRQATISV